MAELIKDITVDVHIDTSELDVAIEKAKQLADISKTVGEQIPKKLKIAVENLLNCLQKETEKEPFCSERVATLTQAITALYPFTRFIR